MTTLVLRKKLAKFPPMGVKNPCSKNFPRGLPGLSGKRQRGKKTNRRMMFKKKMLL